MNTHDKEELALYRAISEIDNQLRVLATMEKLRQPIIELRPGNAVRRYEGEHLA